MTLTFVLNDPPYDSARTTTAFRLIDAALQRDDVNVWAYEGAVLLASAGQMPHGNPLHGRDVEAEDHPTSKDWIAALQLEARRQSVKLDWVVCGSCIDERGVPEVMFGERRADATRHSP